MASRLASRVSLRIRSRLLVCFLGLAFGLVLLPLLLIEGQTRRSLEGELAARLESAAAAASTQIDTSLLPATLDLGPAAGGPARALLVSPLAKLKDVAGLRRIYLLDREGRDQLDTDPRAVPGTEMLKTRVLRRMLEEASKGAAVSSPLFRDERGEMRKTGYARLTDAQGGLLGFVGVEADAGFLGGLDSLRRRIVVIGLLGFGLAAVLSFVLARGLTRPLGDLVEAARAIGAGDLDRAIPVGRPDEIGFLARTLDEARLRLSERDRALRAMVAGIAHEVRNPLGGIQIYAELLDGDASLTALQRERVGKVLREIRRLGGIVEEFLVYARPQASVPVAFDPRGIVAEVLDLLAGSLAERGVQVVAGGPVGPTAVSADPGQVRQVLLNLVRNAAEASPKGGAIRVTWEKQGPTVAISVEDDGPGVPVEQRERIFEPFFTTKSDGAGLGLSIVRHLVEQNGGRVSLECGHRGGCRFTVRLAAAEEGGQVA